VKRMLWISAALVALVATILNTPAGFSAVPDAPPRVDIRIDNFSFVPPTVTIAAGTQVRWVNHDDIPHTVVSEDKRFKSKVMDTDEEFTYNFSQPGTYSYFCSIHPKMTGKVIVEQSSEGK
jgi:plastocyanin